MKKTFVVALFVSILSLVPTVFAQSPLVVKLSNTTTLTLTYSWVDQGIQIDPYLRMNLGEDKSKICNNPSFILNKEIGFDCYSSSDIPFQFRYKFKEIRKEWVETADDAKEKYGVNVDLTKLKSENAATLQPDESIVIGKSQFVIIIDVKDLNMNQWKTYEFISDYQIFVGSVFPGAETAKRLSNQGLKNLELKFSPVTP